MLRSKHVLEENQKCVFTKVFTFYVPAPAAGQEQGSHPAGEGEKRAGSGIIALFIPGRWGKGGLPQAPPKLFEEICMCRSFLVQKD